jgi:hypothetical protein
MKYLRFVALSLSLLLILGMANIGFSHPDSDYDPISVKSQNLRSSAVNNQFQPRLVRGIGQSSNSDQALCFYEQPSGSMLDLSKLCGEQEKTKLLNQPPDSPYDMEAVAQFNNEVYGLEN